MPAKRRLNKRRATVAPEAWAMAFQSGFDYFGELASLGLVEPCALPPESDARAAAQSVWDNALHDSWARHGAAFMADWEPQPGLALPWAAEAFGLPDETEKGARHAD